ncbi:BTAD domain-containing putative transcriptional regulator, partial [Nocardiopsis sp. NPDC049922]|uniref:AfsR/SARP family transcriptional regulator n=1 Tax=Nocardiopsis sp. NPDC049922 TaxID=3155157 RepID=UPI0033F7652D
SAPQSVLVVVEASDLDQGAPTALTATAGVVVCVLGAVDNVGATVDCEDRRAVRVRTRDGEVTREGALRLWSPSQGHDEQEDISVDQAPPPVPEHTRGTEADEPDQVEEEQPEASGGHEPRPVPDHDPGPDKDELHQDEEEQSTSPALPGTDAHPEPRLRVQLFAPEPELTFDGEPVRGLRSVAWTLLSFLALHPRGADNTQITQVCFADSDSTKAAVDRRNATSSLRAVLRPLMESPKEQIIVHENSRYRLDAELFVVDVWEFSRTASLARKEGSTGNLAYAEKLVSLHAQVLLGGRDEEWVARARERCIREAVSACVRLADATDSSSKKIRYLEQACSFDEFNEPLYQRLMIAHQDNGSPEAASQTYRSLKDKLACLGEKPSSESQRIFQECVAAAPEGAQATS